MCKLRKQGWVVIVVLASIEVRLALLGFGGEVMGRVVVLGRDGAAGVLLGGREGGLSRDGGKSGKLEVIYLNHC